ncbi:hypothetical protein QEN19_003611 [Hanseniaspora menglaensis]
MIEISAQDQDNGIGNNGTNISFNYYDGIPDTNLLQTISNNSLSMSFKQLFKKDDTTKEKALNNIVQLLKEDTTVINDINVLVWSMIYPKMIISESRFVKNLANDITFNILNFIKNKKLKNLASYYKDLLPVLIFTLQESDKTVVYNSKKLLYQLFDNDETKIDNLYVNLKVNLMKIVYHLTFVETSETLYNFDGSRLDKEALNSISLKHATLINSAIKLLTVIIHKNDISILKDNEYLNTVLTNEQIYESISIKYVENTGKNGFMSLIELIIVLNNRFKQNNDLKKVFWKTNKKAIKYMSKKLFKLLSKWKENRQQLLSPCTNNLMLLINTMVDVNTFWKYNEDSYKILFKWLLLGPGVFTDLGYYSLLKVLTINMVSQDAQILTLDAHWFKIWQISLQTEINRKGRLSKQYFVEFWDQFFSLADRFENHFDAEIISDMMVSSMKTKTIGLHVLDLFRNHGLSHSKVKTLLEATVFSAAETTESNCLIENSILFLPELELNDSVLKIKGSVLYSNSILFVDCLISNKKCSEAVKAIINEVDNDSLLLSFVNSGCFDMHNDITNLLVPHIINKLVNNPESISNIVSSIKNTEITKQLIETVPSLSDHVIMSGVSDIKADLLNLPMANKLFETENITDFINMFKKFNLELKIEFINANDHFIYDYIYEFEHETQDWLESLQDVLETSKEVFNLILSILQEQLMHLNLQSDAPTYEKNVFELIVVPLGKLNKYNHAILVDYIVLSDFLDLNIFLSDFIELDNELINVSGLEATTLLFAKDLKVNAFKKNAEKFVEIFVKAKFFTLIINTIGLNDFIDKDIITVHLNILQQLISHFSIITQQNNLELITENLEINLTQYKYSSTEIINFVFGSKAPEDGLLKQIKIQEEDLFVVKFYKFKILSILLENSLDLVSKKIFSQEFFPQLEADLLVVLRKDISDNDYNVKFINSTLLLAAIHNEFEDNSCFSKLITYLMSEFHQLKPADFELKTYKNFIILINMFTNNNNKDSLDVNLMRFNGFIKNIKNLYEDLDWYEDEVSYKQNLRVLFLELFIQLNKYNGDFVHHFKDFSEHLVIDNLQICELLLDASLPFEALLSKCTKLYALIDFEESDEDANESLFNLFLNNNSVIEKGLKSILIKNIDKTFIIGKYDLLLETLKDYQNKDLQWVHTCIQLIAKVLNSDKKISAIDFELDRKQLLAKESSSDNSDEILLEKYCIDNRFVNLIKDIDYNEHPMIYLWLIEVVLSYLNETTVNLCNLYVKQLGKNWFSEKVFEVLVNDLNIEFDENKVVGDLTFSKDYLIKSVLYEISKQLVSKSNTPLIFNWFNNLKTGSENLSAYFVKQISPKLIYENMASMKDSSSYKEVMDNFSDFLTISISEKFNIVRAKFDIDDQILDISYQYESNFPLQPISTVLKTNKIG